jgi:hypothetical protein
MLHLKADAAPLLAAAQSDVCVQRPAGNVLLPLMPDTKAPAAPVALHMLSWFRATAVAFPVAVPDICTVHVRLAATLHSPSSLHKRAGRLPVLPCRLDLMLF